MKRMLFPAAVLVTVGLLFACGGSMSPIHVTNGIPMSVTIGDTPPPGVAVLFFEASITGASLQPSDPKNLPSPC
jgi:hypothetical protein